MTTGYTVYARNRDREREGMIEDFQELSLVSRFNAVGSWSLQLDRRIQAAVWMTTPGFGIEVVRDSDGQTVLAGPLVTRHHERNENTNTVTISGADDNIWLTRRQAHPEPATAAPQYTTNEHDVRTGVASTVLRQYVAVNLGSSALGPRRVPGLVLAVDPVLGSTVTGRARWQNLLELLQGLAISGGGLGFRVRQVGTDLEFQVYQPTDKTSSVIFSEDLGNLAGFDYESTAPEADYIYVGGSGEGTARVVKEGQYSPDIATWGRIEKFADRRDTADDAELGQEITEQLDEHGERASLSVTAIDTQSMAYGTHYDLGDDVTILADGEIHERIREVRIDLTPDGPQKVRPVIGTPGRQDIFRLFRVFRGHEKRLTNLERR